MFDLIVTGHRKTGQRGVVPLVLSSAVHVLAIGGMVALPLLFATSQLPTAPAEILTFVSVAPPPPPPPPPAAAAVKPAASRPAPTPRRNPQDVVTTRPRPAPVEAPASIEDPPDDGEEFGVPRGVPGGVVDGVPGGVIGGVVGGLLEAPPPPPPPTPPAPEVPVRTGGQIQAPALTKRVPPVYPPIAASARIEGVVILEATVGRDGRVEDVQVLRSFGLLDKAAVDAVRQWEYAPLLLNGQAERFILTVTVSFSLS
jgi:protein TonB